MSLRDSILQAVSMREGYEYKGYIIRKSKEDPGYYNVYKTPSDRKSLVTAESGEAAREWIDAQDNKLHEEYIDRDKLSDEEYKRLEDLQSEEYYYGRELSKKIDWPLEDDPSPHDYMLDLGIDDYVIVADKGEGDHYTIYVVNDYDEPVNLDAEVSDNYVLAGTNVENEVESMLRDQGNYWREWYLDSKLEAVRNELEDFKPYYPDYDESVEFRPDESLLFRMMEAPAYDEDPEPTDQNYTSADTSINSSKLPAIYKLVNFNEGDVVLDYGGGRFDNGMEYLESLGCIARVYDPYNRSSEYNNETLSIIRENGGADIILCSNVLNVIDTENARSTVLRNMQRLLSSSGTVYITVYEGSGSGEGSPTKVGYQLNRKTADYIAEVEEVFSNVSRRGKLIIAR